MKTTLLAGLVLAAGVMLSSAPVRAEMACCKAGGASCEAGNASFFTSTRCGSCAAHGGEKKMAHGEHGKMGCTLYVTCHEVGNRGFFTATKKHGCCDAKSMGAGGSCCAGHGKDAGKAHH